MKNMYTLGALTLFVLLSAAPLSAQTWKEHTPPFGDTIAIADIEVVNENVIWAVGLRLDVNDSLFNYFFPSKTYIALTKDGGATWSVDTVPMGVNPFVASMTALDGSTAWVSGLSDYGNSKLLKTTNGGKTWKDNSPGFDPVNSWVDYIRASPPAKFIIIGDPRDGEFEIYNTGNLGQVWAKVPGANIPDPMTGEFGYNNVGDAMGNTIWFGTSVGRVYRSKNSGLNWEAFTTPAEAIGFLSFSDENNGIVTEGTYSPTAPVSQLYRTTNGGETWTDITPVNHNFRLLGLKCIPNSSYVIMCGTSGSILKEKLFTTWISPDRGSTWKEVCTGQIASWITFLNAKVGWAGESQQLSHQTKLYQYTGSPLVGLLTPAALDADVTLSPNPSSDVARVQVRAQEITDFLLLLNDSQGNLLRSIEINGVDGFDKDLNVSDLPAGVYTVTVSTAKGSVSRRLTKG